MHRLLSARNIYQSGLQHFSQSSPFIATHSIVLEVKCSFCRKVLLGRPNIENLILVRHQSTRTANALHKASKRRVKYKNYKKYGELLEVNDKTMTETKIAISKLNAVHLSKLASSTVSLGELHQLTAKSQKKPSIVSEVDPELLQKFKEKILKKQPQLTTTVNLEDDKCALLFTSHTLTSLEEKLKTKQFMDMVKESYYNFRKATLYDQKLQDIHCAINEGLNQEFDLSPSLSKEDMQYEFTEPKKGPHALFKEIFFDNQLDSYDQELMSQISTLQSTAGLPHSAIEDIYDDTHDLSGDREFLELDSDHPPEVNIVGLQVKKAKQKQKAKAKSKAQKEKRRLAKEAHMKEDLKAVESRGRQLALHALLAAHTRLLCSLDMTQQAHQVLQYYRSRSNKMPDQPKVTDVKVYNTLLHGYAAKSQYKQAQELFSSMERDNISVDAQTFAAVFEALERGATQHRVQLLDKYAQAMKEKGITLNDLLDKTKFVNDQGEMVLKAIRRLEPNFNPSYTPPDIDYVCPLLEDLKLNRIETRIGLKTSPGEGLFSVEELRERARKQFDIEIKGEIEVQNIDVKDETSETVKFYRQKLSETEAEWRGAVREAFTRNLGTLRSQSNASHAAITLYPYLRVLEVDQFVELIMGEISKLVDGSETYSPTLKLLQRDLGSQVYHKYQIEQHRRNGTLAKMQKIYDEYCSWYMNRDSEEPLNPRQAWQLLQHTHREGADLDIEEAPWPIEIRQNVGKFLYNIIINDVKIDVNMFKPKAKEKKLPAVYKLHRPWGRLVRLELKPHPALARLWAGAAPPSLRMRAALVPLTCPAAPWRTHRAQAYLITHTPLIRMPFNIVNQLQRIEQAQPASLHPVLDGLNQLGEVPWAVNKPVLDLQLQVFRSGGDKKLDIPPPPSALDTSEFDSGKGAAGAFRRRLAINRARAEMYSLWCDALYKLSLANHYRDDIFWLPHNMDFRGRVYACPPHLSQLGADTARALLMFANRRPLGPQGLSWLKLHAVNLTGTMKKETIDERLAYAETVMDDILDSADNPLDGKRWWAKSEEPWQTLACCKEIANAVRSGNPEEYLTGFPVHQDGSCNGLQHYAALGADAAGAAAVNLAPRARPGDVYTAVADKVEEMRVRDAAKGVSAAIVLENFVRRKVIKQTVMTTVYGVTRFGARLQIAKQLKDIEEFPKDQVWTCSQYLTARTFDSLREMFTSTKLIQDWLTDCAKVISGVCGSSVEWVTPLGLPVVQPYYRRAAPSASAAAPAAPAWDQQQRPCTMKQRNAFPPNFIHSLDSSHMMLTALRCQAAGVTFVSVHDCFWTHPDTVHTMNKICREQFVALHSQPILNDLSEFMVQRYSYADAELIDQSPGAANKKRVNQLITEVPQKGDFELDNVLESVYFFS